MAATFNDTTIEKEIRYNRANKDYDCFVAGQYVGSRSNYSDGETLCNEVAYDLISSGACYSATQLDKGSDPDEMAAELPDSLVTPEPVTPIPSLTVAPIYRESNGDLTDTPTDQVAYLDYGTTVGKDKVIVSIAVDNNEEPEVLLFGRDGVSLSRFLASVEMVQRILETVAAAQNRQRVAVAA